MPAQEIEVVSREELAGNNALLARVDSLLDSARNGRESLERTYMDIAIALDDVEKTKAWMSVAHSFDAYVKSCESRFGKSRTQLYGYRSVAKNLLPAITKDQLLAIGISKAMPLAQYSKRKGGKLPEDLINKASDPNVGTEEFRAAVAESQHESPEKGKWYDLGGFFVSADEKIEIDRVFELAGQSVPLPDDCPEWLERKIKFQAMVAECISSWEPRQ